MELSDNIDGKYGTFQKNITGVKAQTGTQIRAGLTNEFIDGREATKAGKEIDLILTHYKKWGRTFTCKQKLILGRDFKATKERHLTGKKYQKYNIPVSIKKTNSFLRRLFFIFSQEFIFKKFNLNTKLFCNPSS